MDVPAGERRRSRRFDISLPVRVTRLSNRAVELQGQTRDVSSVGAYFTLAERGLREGIPIEFLLTLQGAVLNLPEVGEVRLRCRGRVARLDTLEEAPQRGVAATIDRYQFVRD